MLNVIVETFGVDTDGSNSTGIPLDKLADGWLANETLAAQVFNGILGLVDRNSLALEKKILEQVPRLPESARFYIRGSAITDLESSKEPTGYSETMGINLVDSLRSKIDETDLKVTIGTNWIELDSTVDKLEYSGLLPAQDYVFNIMMSNTSISDTPDLFTVIDVAGTKAYYRNGEPHTFPFTHSNDIAQIISGIYSSNKYAISSVSCFDFAGSGYDDGAGGIDTKYIKYVYGVRNVFIAEVEGERGNVPFSLIKRNAYGSSPIPFGVGDYWITESPENPATKWVGTTWVRVSNRMLYAGDGGNTGQEGGSETVTLTTAHMPRHRHRDTGHSHSRGSQEIEGAFTLGQDRYGGSVTKSPSGAFYTGASGSARYVETIDSKTAYRNYFKASRSWTGRSSSEYPYSDYQGSGEGFGIMNPYRRVNMWRRTS